MHIPTTTNSEAYHRSHRLPIGADDGCKPHSIGTRMEKGRAAQDSAMEGLIAMYNGLKAEPIPDHLVALVGRLCQGA